MDRIRCILSFVLESRFGLDPSRRAQRPHFRDTLPLCRSVCVSKAEWVATGTAQRRTPTETAAMVRFGTDFVVDVDDTECGGIRTVRVAERRKKAQQNEKRS